MKFFKISFLLSIKRLLRRSSTLACLLVLPLITVITGFALSGQGGENPITIGILLPESSVRSEEFWNNMQTYSQFQFQVVRAQSKAEIDKNVASGEWEFGYIIHEDFDSMIDNGEYDQLILRVKSPKSTVGITNWTVYSALLRTCAPDIALQYLDDSKLLPKSRQGELADELNNYFSYESVMQVEILPVNGLDMSEGSNMGGLMGASLVRGIIALLLMLFGCLSAVHFSEDLSGGFFTRTKPFLHPAKLFFPFYAAVAALSAAISLLSIFLASLFFDNYFSNAAMEILWMFLYLILIASFAFLLSSVFHGKNFLVSAIPFLMIVALLFSPIIMDIGQYIFVGKYISWLLVPTYYLHAAAGSTNAFILMPVISAILVAAGTFIYKVRSAGKTSV